MKIKEQLSDTQRAHDEAVARKDKEIAELKAHAEAAHAAVTLREAVESHISRPINDLTELYEAMDEGPRIQLDTLLRADQQVDDREWPDRVRLSLSALHGFLVSPLQGWVKTALGIYDREGETAYLEDGRR